MTDAVIVSTARTGLAKSWRGALNMTHGATLGGHAVRAAVERAKIDPGEVEDVIMGCALPEGTTGGNIARQIALRAGLPVTTAGTTVNRFCSSGLQTIAMAAQRVIVDRVPVMVAGGVESISCVQNEGNRHMAHDPWLLEHKPAIYDSMLQTAETVAERYRISREKQDEYGVRSQQRAAAAQAAGRFKDEIVPFTTVMGVADKESGRLFTKEVTLSTDEGIRADTTYEAVARIKPALPGGVIAAGNASQFSDGASACVVMDAKLAEKPGLRRSSAPRARRHESAGHRPVGAERGLRGAGDLLPRPLGNPGRQAQRGRRRDCGRASVRHFGRAPGGARAHRGKAARGEARRGDDVHRRGDGGGGAVRGG